MNPLRKLSSRAEKYVTLVGMALAWAWIPTGDASPGIVWVWQIFTLPFAICIGIGFFRR